MAKAEFGTAKYQAKQLKASGLQKLKYFCQICEKQCRDANGFKNHLSSPSHRGRISELSETGKGRAVIQEYSNQFQSDFLRLLRVNHGTKKINANKFYQEYILNDRNHVHMNSTKWSSLTSFVKHLGTNGLVRVTNDNGSEEGFELDIALVDSSDMNNRAKLLEKQKQISTDEDFSMKLIKQQIANGQKLSSSQEQEPKPPVSLPKTGPVKMTLKPKAKAPVNHNPLFDNDSESEEESLPVTSKAKNMDRLSLKLLGKRPSK